MQKYTHLKDYIDKISSVYGQPTYYSKLTYDLRDIETLNLIYPIGEPIFVHIYTTPEGQKYHIIQPELMPAEKAIKKKLTEILFEKARYEKPPTTEQEFNAIIERLLRTNVVFENQKNFLSKKLQLPNNVFNKIEYEIKKDIVGVGIIEPILKDPYIEDITCVGTANLHVYHKIFGIIETDVRFGDIGELDDYLRHLSERLGKPVSLGRPVVDTSLPDGSRMNIIYAEDISLRGPSFSIRRHPEEPLTITQIIKFGTLNEELAAYLWLCLENRMSIMFCGGTATGKTATLNALLPFIQYSAKIYSVEDVEEMIPPHTVWQQLLTRENVPKDVRVESYDLLRASLRSRPNYILLGEIRDREGAIAFQAMQTGHPVLTTFHAETVPQMIQRLTSHPINVPIRFIDNLHVACMQRIVSVKNRLERRVTVVTEIVGYVRELDKVMLKDVFEWSPYMDTLLFRGFHNSYILEDKITPQLGYKDKRKIYEDLDIRTRILRAMIREKIYRNQDVVKAIREFQLHGIKGLWFPIM